MNFVLRLKEIWNVKKMPNQSQHKSLSMIYLQEIQSHIEFIKKLFFFHADIKELIIVDKYFI